MNTNIIPRNPASNSTCDGTRCGLTVLAFLCFGTLSHGQGTMTFTFEGAPYGTIENVGTYTESGMYFGPGGPGNLVLNGGGITGYPVDGVQVTYRHPMAACCSPSLTLSISCPSIWRRQSKQPLPGNFRDRRLTAHGSDSDQLLHSNDAASGFSDVQSGFHLHEPVPS